MYKRTQSIGFAVNQTARLMHKAMRTQLDIKNMQPAFLPVLLWLSEQDGLTQMELSKRAAIEQPSMAEIVKRMETGGFIERRADPDDGRRQTLHLTPLAKRLSPKVYDWLEQNNASVCDGIAARELETCFRVLDRMVANLESQIAPADVPPSASRRRAKKTT
ncbi:MAG: MarR family transcriptional regulator [Hyphomicrobiales bacterium]|nr:MarR family transcriptional regulator [Hyphomicrobiales bacterium]